MKMKRLTDLLRSRARMKRNIRRKKERYEELVERATSTGSFRYDQEKVKGSTPDGSRMESLVVRYVELEQEIAEAEMELKELEGKIKTLIGMLPPRERDLTKARLIEDIAPDEYARRRGLTRDAYVKRYQRAVARMEQMLEAEENS